MVVFPATPAEVEKAASFQGPRIARAFSFHATVINSLIGSGLRRSALLLMLAILLGCGRHENDKTGPAAFLQNHWQEPLPAQGQPPKHFTALEAALSSDACGTCHPDQLRDWRTALHSRTMGPGIYWQFEELGQAESNRCLRCHAPLAEQKALLAQEMKWPSAPATLPPEYVGEELHRTGLGCAACHVRGHVRYGPPPARPPEAPPVHGGFVASASFEDSQFCAFCHQFAEDGPRLAGKLREDTYAQWRASPYSPTQSCQSCHMPERRHLWRGIHDPEMVRKAIAVDLKLTPLGSGDYRADVVVRNRGAGHHFPTYLVPKVYLILRLERDGVIDREIGRDVIGWQADINMTTEKFDTRIPSGGSRQYAQTFRAPAAPSAWRVALTVEVDPAEHYLRMFRFSLANVRLSDAAKTKLERAIWDAEQARFVAMSVAATP